MIYSKKIDYIFVLIGCAVAIYSQAESQQNVFILILGIVILMYGLFKISSSIPSKKKNDDDASI